MKTLIMIILMLMIGCTSVSAQDWSVTPRTKIILDAHAAKLELDCIDSSYVPESLTQAEIVKLKWFLSTITDTTVDDGCRAIKFDTKIIVISPKECYDALFVMANSVGDGGVFLGAKKRPDSAVAVNQSNLLEHLDNISSLVDRLANLNRLRGLADSTGGVFITMFPDGHLCDSCYVEDGYQSCPKWGAGPDSTSQVEPDWWLWMIAVGIIIIYIGIVGIIRRKK